MSPRRSSFRIMSMPSDKKTSTSIYRLTERHIPEVAKIEAQTFSEPWSERALSILCTDGYPSFVLCEETGEVAGYVSTARALDEIQIINVAVRADRKRRGYGKALLDALDLYCEGNSIEQISLEVRESNSAAIALYEKCGYINAGLRKNFYRLPTESAIVMIKNFNRTGKTQC